MNARNSSATVKQPSGTNHFQFRFHQFGLGVAGCVSGWSTSLFYFSDEVICNASVQAISRNDGFIAVEGYDGWEAVTPCSARSNLDGFDDHEARLRA